MAFGTDLLKRVTKQGLITGLSNRPFGLGWLLHGGRTYPPTYFTLDLDHQDRVSLIRSVSGGGIRADVTTFQQGPDYYRSRQIGGKLKFDDLKLNVGMGASKAFWEWMKQFFTGKGYRQTGAISVGDDGFRERVRREFRGALIHEITFPELDASQKDAEAYFTAGLAVENVEFQEGSGILPIQGGLAGVLHQKNWLRSNFRFMLDGFTTDTVTKIDSFTVKHNVMDYYVGGSREPIKTPSWIEYPNITFYLPESCSYEFDKAAEQRIVRGKSPGYLTGMIEMIDKQHLPLCSLSFAGAEIVSVSSDTSDATKDQAKLVKVELSVETMTFEYSLIAELQHWGAVANNIGGPILSPMASKAFGASAQGVGKYAGVITSPTEAVNIGVDEAFKKV